MLHKGTWIYMDLLNPEQFSAAEQRKKNPTTPYYLPYSSSLPCCSSTQDGPRGLSFCFVILVYCPLSALSLSAWGGFFCCCYSSVAVCQLPEALSFLLTTLCWLHSLCLAKLNLLVKMKHANLFFSYQVINHFLFLWTLNFCWEKWWPS